MPTFPGTFHGDLDAIDWYGQPFALSRYADGEWALLAREGFKPAGIAYGTAHWYAQAQAFIREPMREALRANLPGFYLGISAPCCQKRQHESIKAMTRCPDHQLTFAGLFGYANYERFRKRAKELDLLNWACVVSRAGGDYEVPLNAVNEEWPIDDLVDALLAEKRPILVGAGPASGVIAHRYWLRQTPGRRQIIVDVGSAFDEELHGIKTRPYMTGGRWKHHACSW